MLKCCQGTGSVRSNHYGDLETILHNLPYQQQSIRRPEIQKAPKMNISLDLPGYDIQYLPTYYPGQNITGQVKIQLENNSPIKVSHLRIALFGNVQVYGSHPGHPLTNGLFDYQKNEQLINTGLRIVRRSSSPTVDDGSSIQDIISPPPLPTTEQHEDNTRVNHPSNEEEITSLGDERRWRLYCRRDDRASGDQYGRQSAKNTPNIKTPEDKHIEKLIRKAAAIDHTSNVSSGVLDDDMECFYREETSSAFELNPASSATNAISFSIRVPTSRRLSGTFDHPNYPISYRVVAIMKCRDKENNEITCYSTVRLRLESSIDVNSRQFSKRIQSNPTRHFVQSKNNLMSGFYTYVLSSSSVLTHLLYKMTQRKSKVSPNYCGSYVQCHLELSKQAFERSQYIPLELKLSNNATPNFKISAIKIYMEFTRRVNMTCSMNEEVEGKVLQTSTVVFKSLEEEESEDGQDIVFFKHANMCFDLSKLIQVPDDCTSTITAESTRSVFSLNYDINVKLDITGVIHRTDQDYTTISPSVHQEEIHYYYANDRHIVKEQPQDNLPKEPYHQKFKTYNVQLEPIAVVIGNSNYLTNNVI